MPFLRPIKDVPQSDEELAARYRAEGDLQVLGSLYSRYMELVHGVCLKYTGDREEAKDCVLQLFEELTVKLKQHEVTHFRPWLYQVARNHCLMRLRKKDPVKLGAADPDLMQSEETVHLNGAPEREDRLDRLQDCLQGLGVEQRQVVELFYLEGKSYHEIAALTGKPWNGVRSLIQNGRRNLKICMERKEAVPQK